MSEKIILHEEQRQEEYKERQLASAEKQLGLDQPGNVLVDAPWKQRLIRGAGGTPSPVPDGYAVHSGQVPNIDKLTRKERAIMNWLPGFSESNTGKALAWFGDTWAGKALMKLDILVEVLERGTGFATQYADAWANTQNTGDPSHLNNFKENLGAAWYAGGLSADMMNLPDVMGEKLSFPMDLPGIEGVVDARQQIAGLMSQGMSGGEALIQVRDEYYNSIGALALRAQLQDAFVHIAGDPLMLIGKVLSPIERTRKFTRALQAKVLPGAAEEIAVAASKLDEVLDASRIELRLAEAADNADEVARITETIGDIEKAVEETRGFIKYAAENQMSPFEEKVFKVFNLAVDEAPTGIAAHKLNPFALTRASRSHELMNTLLTNMTSKVFAAGGDPESWVRAITRAADGLFTPEFGHAIISMEGRAVSATLKHARATSEDLLKAFRRTELFEGPFLRRISGLLNENPQSILNMLADGEDVSLASRIVERVGQLGDEAADVPLLMQSANLAMDEASVQQALGKLGIFDEFAIYDPALFQLELSNRLIDATAQLAIARFGIAKQAGIYRFADAIKAAESLAFLKMNPAYPLRNAMNNFFTSVGRGVFGNPVPGYYDDLFLKLGIPEMPRFRSGVGMMGLSGTEVAERGVAETLGRGAKLIREFEAPRTGTLGKITNFFNKKKGLRMGVLAQKFEQQASVRAYGAKFTDYMSQSHRMGKGLTRVQDFDPALARLLGPENTALLEKAIEGNWSIPLIEKALFVDNPHINIANILEEAARRNNLPIDNILGADFTTQVGTRLEKAAREGGESAVKSEMGRIRKLVQQHIESHTDNVVNTLLEQTAAKVSAEGPGALPHVMSEAMDDLYGAQVRHAGEMAKLSDDMAGIADPALRGKFWDNLFKENEAFYGRHWERFGARKDGMIRGLDDALQQAELAGKATPELRTAIKSLSNDMDDLFEGWSGGWKEFFERRMELFEEVRKAPRAERGAKFEAAAAELDGRYVQMVGKEDEFLHAMDSTIGRMLPEEQSLMYMQGRNRVALIRRELRDSVVDFRKIVRELEPAQREVAYQKFWQNYMAKSRVLQREEQASRVAMLGDRAAQEMLGMTPEQSRLLMQARELTLRGLNLSDEQQAALDAANRLNTTSEELNRLRGIYGELDEELFASRLSVLEQEVGAVPEGFARESLGQGPLPENVVEMEAEHARLTKQLSGMVGSPEDELQVVRDQIAAIDDVLRPVAPERLSPEGATSAIQDALRGWVLDEHNNPKSNLIKLVEDYPEQAREVQDFAQWWLREQGFDNVRLSSGKLHRGVRVNNIEDVRVIGWDSMTAREDVARLEAGVDGFYLEFEVPTENIFTHHEAHPSLQGIYRRGEAEFILNEQGVAGARLTKINGEPPTPEQMAILQKNLEGILAGEVDMPFMPDLNSLVKDQLIDGQVIDNLWFTRGSQALDDIEAAALDIAGRPPTRLDIPDEAQNLFRSYVDNIKTETGENLYAAARMGEWGRDSALLNYNRRYNYNTWLGVVAPYEFWATQTAYKWALHSLDKPAMFMTYLRMKKFANTAFRPEEGLPARLRGSFRIKMPFMPDWMGDDLFIDPMRSALPFDQFTYAYEQYSGQAMRDEGKAERVLEELLNDGNISQQQYNEALQTRGGPVWERAVSLGRQDDTERRLDPFDFVNMMVSPHAPIAWAANIARGTPEEIQPFLPITRSIKGVTAMLGIGPAGGINPEASLRKALGLPAFDKWDPYRVERMLSNMSATGEISVDVALKAQIEGAQSQDPAVRAAYEEAVRKAGIEYGWGSLGSITGIPTKAYPVGEEHLRKLKDEYEAAWEKYEGGDPGAVQEFYEEYPEYETRLALWKTPEERMRSFLVDNIWDTWHDMPKLHQNEVKDQLGELFQSAFLSKDTRSYNSIPMNSMQVWLKVMGGDPPGQFTYSEDAHPISLTNPEVAHRMDAFYNTRAQLFQYNDVIWPLQDTYFKLEEGAARKKFRASNPLLEQYWNWRRDFMERNPDLAPYIEDDPDKRPKYPSEQALREAEQAQPALRWFEWQTVLTTPLWRLARDNLRYGDKLLDSEIEELEEVADRLGLDFVELMLRLEAAYQEEEGALTDTTPIQ